MPREFRGTLSQACGSYHYTQGVDARAPRTALPTCLRQSFSVEPSFVYVPPAGCGEFLGIVQKMIAKLGQGMMVDHAIGQAEALLKYNIKIKQVSAGSVDVVWALLSSTRNPSCLACL
jgi:hypothetical protein